MDFIRFFIGEEDKKRVRSLNALASSIQSRTENLETSVGLLNTVVDLTSASSDYELSVGETAKINITVATTPLHIAVEDGVYEIKMLFDSGSFAADQTIELQANNTTYAGEFTMITLSGDTAIATDEVDVATVANDTYVLGINSRPRIFSGTLTISGLLSGLSGIFYAVVTGSSRIRCNATWRSGSVAHTSLGTLSIGEDATGIIYVKRIA